MALETPGGGRQSAACEARAAAARTSAKPRTPPGSFPIEFETNRYISKHKEAQRHASTVNIARMISSDLERRQRTPEDARGRESSRKKA